MSDPITATRETVRTVKIPADVMIVIKRPNQRPFRVAEVTETLIENTHAGTIYIVRGYGPALTVLGNAHATQRGDHTWRSDAYRSANGVQRRDTIADIPESVLEFLAGRGTLLAAGTPIEELARI
jgi:hypothetical protein